MTSKPEFLLDSSALIALLVEGHVFRTRIIEWLEEGPRPFVVCSITQGAFLRAYLRLQPGGSFAEGQRVLSELSRLETYRFVPDDQNYVALDPRGIRGHRQVTDAYLVGLAGAHGMKLATFDDGLLALYPTQTVRIPVRPIG